MNKKYCPGCDGIKALSLFVRNLARPDGKGVWCRDCNYKRKGTVPAPRKTRKTNPETNLRYRFNSNIASAKERHLNWNLTFEQWTSLIVGKICHYCDGELPKSGSGLDRKNNNRGYVLKNVVPCCQTCNWIKGPNLTYLEMVAISNLLKIIRKRPDSITRAFQSTDIVAYLSQPRQVLFKNIWD